MVSNYIFFTFSFFLLQVKSIVDSRRVKVHGGKGGDGCVSLLRICNNPLGGPDGGDGGHGGHVIFKVIGNSVFNTFLLKINHLLIDLGYYK